MGGRFIGVGFDLRFLGCLGWEGEFLCRIGRMGIPWGLNDWC